jgi:hypothetical protein
VCLHVPCRSLLLPPPARRQPHPSRPPWPSIPCLRRRVRLGRESVRVSVFPLSTSTDFGCSYPPLAFLRLLVSPPLRSLQFSIPPSFFAPSTLSPSMLRRQPIDKTGHPDLSLPDLLAQPPEHSAPFGRPYPFEMGPPRPRLVPLRIAGLTGDGKGKKASDMFTKVRLLFLPRAGASLISDASFFPFADHLRSSARADCDEACALSAWWEYGEADG